MPRSRRESRSFAVMALVSFLVGTGILALMIWRAEQLTALGLTGRVYYVLLIPVGLAAALTLFGGMRSYAVLRQSKPNFALELRGGAAIFVLTLVGGFKLVPDPSPLTLTAFVRGPGGPQDIVVRGAGNERVILTLGGNEVEGLIDGNGKAPFPAIESRFRGRKAAVRVEPTDRWNTLTPDVVLNSEAVFVTVKRKPIIARGRVHESIDRKPVAQARVVIDSTLRTTSGPNGEFELEIPAERLRDELSIDVSHQNYQTDSRRIRPEAGPIDVLLKPKQTSP